MAMDRAWLSSELLASNWTRRLDDAEQAAILALENSSASANLVQISRSLAKQIESGFGAVLLKGFPILKDEVATARIALAFSYLLGIPVSQTRKGRLVSFIRDEGGDASSPTVRGHQTSAALPFHCDRTDLIALLCVRQAKMGGSSQVASAIAVRNILERERPDLLKELYFPFPQDRRGEEEHGQAPWIMMPILFDCEGRFVSRYIRRFIESAARFPDAPRLTVRQVEALNMVDAILARPEVAVTFDLESGDLLLINNYTVWHARTAFENSGEAQRLLLRLWISPANSRALPKAFGPLYGNVGAGAVRGGVPPPCQCNLGE
jgi:hypothetical protein